MSSENGHNNGDEYHLWRANMQIKVEEMHDDVRVIRALVPRLEPLATLPQEVKLLSGAIEKLGDAALRAAIGTDRIPMKIFNAVVQTLCVVIIMLAISFAGAQGWFTPILVKFGLL